MSPNVLPCMHMHFKVTRAARKRHRATLSDANVHASPAFTRVNVTGGGA